VAESLVISIILAGVLSDFYAYIGLCCMMMNDVDEKIVTMEDGDGDNEANLGWLYRVAQLK